MQRHNRRKRRGVATVIGTLFFVLIAILVISTFIFMFNSFNNYANVQKSLSQRSLQGKETSLAFQSFIYGSPLISLTPTVPSGIVAYVPIKLSNSQSSPVLGGSQVMLNVNWNAYSTYLDNPVDNVLFFDFSGNALYAWMENGSSNIASNSVTWVKLNSTGIPASSLRTIYLGFYSTGSNHLSASGPFGEAPQLSTTYAQYDDGANVFLAYFNGNTPTSSFNLGASITLTKSTGVSYGSGTINALHLTGTGNDITIVYKSVSLSNSPIIAESNFKSQGLPTSQGAVSLDDNILPASSGNAIGA